MSKIKKYIITEEQFNNIKNYSLNEGFNNVDEIPEFINKSIELNKTSLGNHPSFPPETSVKFEKKILQDRFKELSNKIKDFDDDDDISNKTKKELTNLLDKYLLKIFKIEEQHTEELESLCKTLTKNIFNVDSDDNIDINCHISNNFEIKSFDDEEDVDIEYEDNKDILNINDEILKRRLINALIEGAGNRLTLLYKKVLNKLFDINPKLPELYNKVIILTDYLDFIKEVIPTNDNTKGIVYVELFKDKPSIDAYGINFIVLLNETIKGVLQLIASQSLPVDINVTKYIISKADKPILQNWDKRFGVPMWDIINDNIDEFDFENLPYLINELFLLNPEDFFNQTKEIFGKTKNGKRWIKHTIEDIKNQKTLNEIDKTVRYTDSEYFTPEELISNISTNETTSTGSAGDYSYDAPAFTDDETADHSNLIQKSIEDGKKINEEKDYYDFWDEMMYKENDILYEFLNDKKNGIKQKKWRLIPKEQYKNALIEFMKYGKFMRFPAKYVEQWVSIVANNTASINAITEYAGHSTNFPYDEFVNVFFNDETEEIQNKYRSDFDACSDYLEEIGFYDWCVLPDGSDAWSDYGLEPLVKLIMELEEQETPEQKIVVINKILDVYHQRGDLASAFIEGGSATLSQISN